MQHFGAGNEDTRKPKVDAATQEKLEAERKLYEQHAADLYLRKFDKDNTNYWRRLDDIEVTEEKQVPEDPNGSTLHASRTERTTPLFFKEGIYENQKGALLKLSKDGNIFLGKNASFEDAIDFALRGQGAFAKGIEYDVGSIALGTQSTAYLDFKNRLKNIQKGFDLGEKQGFAFTLSDDTKQLLSLLLENQKISQKEYDSILQREITVKLSAQNRQNEFLKKVTEKEIENASIAKAAAPAALKIELEKTDPDNKEIDTKAKAVLKHADEKIGKIQQHAELLERVANNVDQQVSQLKQHMDDKAKYDGAQNDTTIPQEERDRYKVQSDGIEEGLKGNKWLSNHEEQLKSLDHHGENIKNLIENARSTLAVVEDTLKENAQTKLADMAAKTKKEYEEIDKNARKLLEDVETYNKGKTPAEQIDLASTDKGAIKTKLEYDSDIKDETLNKAKEPATKTAKDAYEDAHSKLDSFKKNDEENVPNADDRAKNNAIKEEHAKLTALQTKLTETINGSKPNQKGEIEKPGLVQRQEKLKEQEENIRKAAKDLEDRYKAEQQKKTGMSLTGSGTTP